ncbi:hypothetical protein JOC37_002474 [Desulfohalotomaculum tongense]|uniref:hypothetical protein n=1 Tax=Desulforadius tongensis TaxID=1216062 RepID=UPI00195A013A|nr:hypothetical protein [Desulforadius tongensis]MBM7856049.1 hypothetical protein [Desulforadius tongensis]
MDGRYHEIMKRTIELAETCLEGLEHIKLKLKEGNIETTVTLLRDVLNSYFVMEKSIQPIRSHILPNQLEKLEKTLRDDFDLIVSFYERGEIVKAAEVMELKLLPDYKRWHGELDRCLIPFLIS